MKQIVTIDFDIIMGPSIDLYNDRIGPYENSVEETIRKFPCLNGMFANLDIYRYLTNFIQTVDKNKISFITKHREMRNFLKDINEPIDLINIDHHHDIEYNGLEANSIENEHDGNWVKTYYQKNVINSYTWICNTNSTPIENSLTNKFFYQNFYISEEILEELNPDMLIICLSPEWVPPVYHPLYTLWKEII